MIYFEGVTRCHGFEVVTKRPGLKNKGIDVQDRNLKKRLVVWITKELHQEIKARAAFRGINMKAWLEIAIAERIAEENKYE